MKPDPTPAPSSRTSRRPRRQPLWLLWAACISTAPWAAPAAAPTAAPPAETARPPALGAAAASQPARAGASQTRPGSAQEPSPARSQKAREAAVQRWAKAWSRRDAKAYLAAYAPGFLSADRTMSHQTWAERRRDSLRASESIRIEISELQWDARGDDWVASFLQTSLIDGRYQEQRKQLLLRKYGQRWLIIGERDDG